MKKVLSVLALSIMAFGIGYFVTVGVGSNSGAKNNIESEIKTTQKQGLNNEVDKNVETENLNADQGDTQIVDLTTLSPTMVYAEVYNMFMYPDDYMGKTIKVKGIFGIYEDMKTGETFTSCVIQDATACCAQGMEFELGDGKVYPDDYPSESEEIVVTGTYQTYEEDGLLYCYLADATLEY